ncbi:MAG: hypothetical protein CMF45_00410 [Legionellales bacterium]|nr:hypothetical protein [Legionellales bacterium]
MSEQHTNTTIPEEEKFYGNPMIGAWFEDNPIADYGMIIPQLTQDGKRRMIWSKTSEEVEGIEWVEDATIEAMFRVSASFKYFPHRNGKKLLYEEMA